MPEFLTLLPPDDARDLLFSHLPTPQPDNELVEVTSSLGRVTAEDILAPHPLPEFPRSTVDGYAVHAADTFGASDSLPAYLSVIGEVPMGDASGFVLGPAQCVLIHTGGMLPPGANAVVMLEFTQTTGCSVTGTIEGTEIEILRAVAEGENIIRIGEDVSAGMLIIKMGSLIRPAEIGGLTALGILELRVARRIKVGLISSGDEVVDPYIRPRLGQVRDINTYTLGALVSKAGGEPVSYGIVPDRLEAMKATAAQALARSDLLLITAGSSASTRDMTAEVIHSLGAPGVLVHGINTRPGKPTILGVCNGKAVLGLPGNPVSALVNGYLFVVPLIEWLLGSRPSLRPMVTARLAINLPSQAGREDWWPVRLSADNNPPNKLIAEPIFGKSNLIFTLAAADGLLRIPPDATGLSAGAAVDVMMI